jgi:acetyl-CoA carboxylase carboxyl transferase subunit beta
LAFRSVALPERTPAQSTNAEKRSVGQGLFRKCAGCGVVATVEEMTARFHVCAACDHHHPMPVADWVRLLLDDGAFEAWDEHIAPADPLGFDDGKPYPERLARAQRNTGLSEGVRIGQASIEGRPVAFGCFVFAFMGGSMGSVVGERITRLFERAALSQLPVVLVHSSGGARMQEGILSLMQMAKTVGALGRYRATRKPYVSVLVHPTTGGVAASTALLGDLNIAEPGALIGFAGPRVIEGTLRTTLPEGFQRSEFLVAHGMVDAIVPRHEIRAALHKVLGHLGGIA